MVEHWVHFFWFILDCGFLNLGLGVFGAMMDRGPEVLVYKKELSTLSMGFQVTSKLAEHFSAGGLPSSFCEDFTSSTCHNKRTF